MKTKVIYFLYRCVQALASPLLLFYFLLRAARRPAYFRTLWQRLGFLSDKYKETLPGAIWLHAVSVGEVIACTELVRRLRAELPQIPLFVSTATLTGRETADRKLRDLTDGVFYAPLDFVFAVRRVLRTIRPSVVVVLETEIWPNLFRETRRTGCALVIVNGRISDRVAGRYIALRRLFGAVLECPQKILAQSEPLRRRFIEAGAQPDRVVVGGNLKYDFEPRQPDPAIASFFENSKVWIAASTTADSTIAEEDFVIDAFRKLPGWKLLLAPRKPERFDEVASKLESAGIPFVRRSLLTQASQADVMLLDTIGELASLFPLARVVFMGGTLADRGGHNILEPAFFAKPIVVGPHMENFRDIAEHFRAHHAVREISDGTELATAVELAANDAEIGKRALACANSRRGATALAVREIVALHAQSCPCYRASLPLRILLRPFAELWKWGGARKRAKDRRWETHLQARVISVGNITVGGTGKTPIVLELALQLARTMHAPGILTRGYGRQSPHQILTLEPGARIPVVHTGDEPQIFLRSGAAYVGIGADRYATGKLLEGRYPVKTVILDDGFQHLRLARDLDIVLIDALSPFGNCEIVPLGRLREPLEGLRRADIFIVTRADMGRILPGIEHRLRQLNPRAPIFRSRIVPEYWVENTTREHHLPSEIAGRRSIAFCGLGNPESFWRTLAHLDTHPVEQLEFGDHHVYTPREMRRMPSPGIEALLTTEKDAVNLCEECGALILPAKLYWLKIRVEIENEPALLDLCRGEA